MDIKAILLMLKHKFILGKSISVNNYTLFSPVIPASLYSVMILIETSPPANCVTLGKTGSQLLICPMWRTMIYLQRVTTTGPGRG